MLEKKWETLPEETFVLDIETDRIMMKDPLPCGPQPFTSVLESNLWAKMSEENRFEGPKEEFWIDFALKMKQMFLNFVIYALVPGKLLN